MCIKINKVKILILEIPENDGFLAIFGTVGDRNVSKISMIRGNGAPTNVT